MTLPWLISNELQATTGSPDYAHGQRLQPTLAMLPTVDPGLLL